MAENAGDVSNIASGALTATYDEEKNRCNWIGNATKLLMVQVYSEVQDIIECNVPGNAAKAKTAWVSVFN